MGSSVTRVMGFLPASFQLDSLGLGPWMGQTDGRTDRPTATIGCACSAVEFLHQKTSGFNSPEFNNRKLLILRWCSLFFQEIPAGGCDCWFDLYRDRKKKTVLPGRCRLRLQLTTKKVCVPL